MCRRTCRRAAGYRYGCRLQPAAHCCRGRADDIEIGDRIGFDGIATLARPADQQLARRDILVAQRLAVDAAQFKRADPGQLHVPAPEPVFADRSAKTRHPILYIHAKRPT